MSRWNEKVFTLGDNSIKKNEGVSLEAGEGELSKVLEQYSEEKLEKVFKKDPEELKDVLAAYKENPEGIKFLKLLIKKEQGVIRASTATLGSPAFKSSAARPAVEKAKANAEKNLAILEKKVAELERPAKETALKKKIEEEAAKKTTVTSVTSSVTTDPKGKTPDKEEEKKDPKAALIEAAKQLKENKHLLGEKVTMKTRIGEGDLYIRPIAGGFEGWYITSVEFEKKGKKDAAGKSRAPLIKAVTAIPITIDKDGNQTLGKPKDFKGKQEIVDQLQGFNRENLAAEPAEKTKADKKELPTPDENRAYEIATEYNDVLLGRGKWNATGPDRVTQHQFIEKIEKEVPQVWLEANLHLYKRMREMVLMEEGARMRKWRTDRATQETEFAKIQKGPDGNYVKMVPNAEGVLVATPVTAEEYDALKRDITLLNDEIFTTERTKKRAEYDVLKSEVDALQSAIDDLDEPETQAEKNELAQKKTELAQKKTPFSQKRNEYIQLLQQEAAYYKKYNIGDSEAAHLLVAFEKEEELAKVKSELSITQKEVETLVKKKEEKETWEENNILGISELQGVLEDVLADAFSRDENFSSAEVLSCTPANKVGGFEVTARVYPGEKTGFLKKKFTSLPPITFKFVIKPGTKGLSSLNTDAFKISPPAGMDKGKFATFSDEIMNKFTGAYTTHEGEGRHFNKELLIAAGKVLGKNLNEERNTVTKIEDGKLVFIDKQYTEAAFEALEKEIEELEKVKSPTSKQLDTLKEKKKELAEIKIPTFTEKEQEKLEEAEEYLSDLEDNERQLETEYNNELSSARREAGNVDLSYRTPPRLTRPTGPVITPPIITPPITPTGPTGPVFTPATGTEIEAFALRIGATDPSTLTGADLEFFTKNQAAVEAKRAELEQKTKQEREQRLKDLEQAFTDLGKPELFSGIRKALGEDGFNAIINALTSADAATFIVAAEEAIKNAPLEPESDERLAIQEQWQLAVAGLKVPTITDLVGKEVTWHDKGTITITGAPVEKGNMYEIPTSIGVPIRLGKNDERSLDYFLEQIGKTDVLKKLEEVNAHYTEELRKFDEAEQEKNTRDPLFADAARIIIETGLVSASLIQRRLALGAKSMERVKKIMSQLERAGIVGEEKGTTREIKVTTKEDLEKLLIKLG
jgi:hypothetical protein